MLMQLAVQRGMIVHQMDVKTAYLNAPFDCELYIEQPEGFVSDDKTDGNLVLKLKKSLYGLKQSGRNWNNMLHDYPFLKVLNSHQRIIAFTPVLIWIRKLSFSFGLMI